jgi:hypothetical protein
MARFARDVDALPAPLGDAADRLEASIERYTRGLLRGAESRASAISDHAARSAERKTAALTAQQAARMLEAIDLVESRITESFASLKEEAEALLGRLDATRSSGRQGRHDTESSGELDQAMAELLSLDELSPG